MLEASTSDETRRYLLKEVFFGAFASGARTILEITGVGVRDQNSGVVMKLVRF